LSTTTLDDVQPMRTLEAVLWKHLYLRFHIFDANTAGCKIVAAISQRKTIPPQVLWRFEHRGTKINTLNW